ncbi:hypothetical protein P3L10_014137 [Capsicum annuum]
MPSSKQAFLFITFFVAISVNLSWNPKVVALRDLSIDVVKMKGKLLFPLGYEITCGRSCSSHSDCSDGTVCRTCSYNPNPFGGYWDCHIW